MADVFQKLLWLPGFAGQHTMFNATYYFKHTFTVIYIVFYLKQTHIEG